MLLLCDFFKAIFIDHLVAFILGNRDMIATLRQMDTRTKHLPSSNVAVRESLLYVCVYVCLFASI